MNWFLLAGFPAARFSEVVAHTGAEPVEYFYFRPGHEEYPTYFNEQVRLVIANAAKWAAPTQPHNPIRGNVKPLENIEIIGGENHITSRVKSGN